MARILKTEIKTNIGLQIVNEYVNGTSSSTNFYKDDVIEALNYVKDSEVVTVSGRLESIGAEIIPNQKKKYERLTDPIADRLKLNTVKLDMSTAMYANQTEIPTREILEYNATEEVKRVKILPIIEVDIKVTLSDGTVTATTLKEGMECNNVKLLGADGDNKMDFIIGAFVYSINPETLEVNVIGIQTSGISSTIIELLAIKHCGEGTEVQNDPDVNEPGCTCPECGCGGNGGSGGDDDNNDDPTTNPDPSDPGDNTDPDPDEDEDGKEDPQPPVSEDTKYAVTLSTVDGGTVIADLQEAKVGEEITLTLTSEPGYRLNAATMVTDATGVAVETTPTDGLDTFKFTMPKDGVTVTPVFEKTFVVDNAPVSVEKFVGAATQFSNTFYNQLTENMKFDLEKNQLVSSSTGNPIAGKELTDDNWWFTLTDGKKISKDELKSIAFTATATELSAKALKVSVGNNRTITSPDYIIDENGDLKISYAFVALAIAATGKLEFFITFNNHTSATAILNVAPLEDSLKCSNVQFPEGETESSMQISLKTNADNTELEVGTKENFDSSNWSGKMILISLANEASEAVTNPIFYITRKTWDGVTVQYGFSRNEDEEPDKTALGFYPIGLTAGTQRNTCVYEIATAQRHGVAKMNFTFTYAEGTRK